MAASGENGGQINSGKGLALPGLIVGLLTGAAVYGIFENWIDDRDAQALPITVLFFIVTAAAAYLLLAETNRLLKAAIAAALIAAILVIPDYFMAGAAGDDANNLSAFPAFFWFGVSRGLAAYILITLVKASLEAGRRRPIETSFSMGSPFH